VFQRGFVDALRATTVLPVAVLGVAALACLAMKSTAGGRGEIETPPAEPSGDQNPAEASRALLRTLTGSWVAQSCYAVAALGVADVLADGPKTSAEMATACEADPHALHRIMLALASAGLFEQDGEDTFALTPVTDLLRTDAPNSMRHAAIMIGEEVFRSFGEILHTVRNGTPAFDRVYGMSMYDYLAANPAVARTFNAALGSRRTVPAALSMCDLTGVRTLVDVGGGNGDLLAEVLASRPALRGILLELPEAVGQARERVRAAMVDDRAVLVEGDFFEEVPAGGDLYVLSRCLHNWKDDKALAILCNVRLAMKPGSRLVILERVIPTSPGPSPAKIYDLLMLAMVEGRNRSESEYRTLASKAGFDVVAVHAPPVSDPNGESAIEAVAT
jgi:SAM-dependent methyltransferase